MAQIEISLNRFRAASRKRARCAWLALFALLQLGCFESTIERVLRLTFHADGGVEAELSIRLMHDHELLEDATREAVAERLRQASDELLSDYDPWADRFADLDAARETYSWERSEGELSAVRRTAELDDPDRLGELFQGTDVFADVRSDDEYVEFFLQPGAPTGGSRRDRRRVDEALKTWSRSLSEYFAAVERLYEHLDDAPDRAEICFLLLFGEEVDATAQERKLTEDVAEAMDAAWSVLEREAGEAESIEEVSRRVFDPFPAQIEIELPHDPEEAEGFLVAGTTLRIREISLWSSLSQLRELRPSPDPLVLLVDAARTDTEPVVDDLAALPRRAAAAESDEILEAILGGLEAEPIYRALWRTPRQEPSH